MQVVTIDSQDIGMGFNIEKFVMIKMKIGKR